MPGARPGGRARGNIFQARRNVFQARRNKIKARGNEIQARGNEIQAGRNEIKIRFPSANPAFSNGYANISRFSPSFRWPRSCSAPFSLPVGRLPMVITRFLLSVNKMLVYNFQKDPWLRKPKRALGRIIG
jgi:hypothetical protein